jgi:hypothetical protein
MSYNDFDDCFDGLRLCSVCGGDRYTRDDLCNECRQQKMIDNDDLSWMDAPDPSTDATSSLTDEEHNDWLHNHGAI